MGQLQDSRIKRYPIEVLDLTTTQFTMLSAGPEHPGILARVDETDWYRWSGSAWEAFPGLDGDGNLVLPSGVLAPMGMSGTFEAMPDPTTIEPYTTYFATNVGNYDGIRTFGSLWITDGMTWLPVGGKCCLWNHAARIQLATSLLAETLQSSILLPAVLLRDNDSIEFKYMTTRSGTTDDVTFRVRLSPDLTIGGSSFALSSMALTGTSLSLGGTSEFRRDNSGQVQFLGKDADGFGAGASSTPIVITGTALTGQNLDNATYLHLTAQKAGSANSGTLEHFEVNLYRR